MFSRRLAWPHLENRLAAVLREMRRRGAAILDLTESNPTRVSLYPPEEERALAAELAAAIADPELGAYDPDPRGLPSARAAVAAHLQERGQAASADRMVLTASTSEAYALLFKLLADPGDAVMVPRPSYPLFDYLAAFEAVRVATYPLPLDDRFRLDPAAIASTLDAAPAAPMAPERSAPERTASPRAVVLVNPNNPTGTAVRASEAAEIDRLCGDRGIAIISDEVFLDYPFPSVATSGRAGQKAAEQGAAAQDRPVSMAAPRPPGETPRALTFTLGGLSKGSGLPQMKLGWVLVDGPPAIRDEALGRLEFLADGYLSVGAPVQRAASRLLALGSRNRDRILARVHENLAALSAALPAESACRPLPADGGWAAIVQIPAVLSEEELTLALLEQDGVLVHPGYFFDIPREAFLVLSLLPEPSRFAAGLQRILSRLDR
jgi:aspartate/methionine/tyrosine aminotransferase